MFTSTATEIITQPWFEDDWGKEVMQQKISKKYIENEDDALLKYPLNLQGGYSLVNKEARNRWGIPRGYAIHPGYSPIHNVSDLACYLVQSVMTSPACTADRPRLEASAEQRQLGSLQSRGFPPQGNRADVQLYVEHEPPREAHGRLP